MPLKKKCNKILKLLTALCLILIGLIDAALSKTKLASTFFPLKPEDFEFFLIVGGRSAQCTLWLLILDRNVLKEQKTARQRSELVLKAMCRLLMFCVCDDISFDLGMYLSERRVTFVPFSLIAVLMSGTAHVHEQQILNCCKS